MPVDLGKQVGPLPVGAWIVVVGGGLGIALYSRNAGSAPPEIVEDTGTPDGVGDGSVGGWTETTPNDPLPDQQITNNDEWGNRSINWLIGQGYPAAWVYSAITKALSGGQGSNKLGVREYALWTLALTKWGAPPYPVNVPPPGTIKPPPRPKPPIRKHAFVAKRPPGDGKCARCGRAANNWDFHERKRSVPSPHTFRYARVTPAPAPGSTLKSLARIYYKDAGQWHRIYQANRKGQRRADGTPGLIEDANRLRVGWRLIIPR